MLFCTFLAARRAAVVALLGLGVAVGVLEGSFVLLVKSALGTGPLAWDWPVLLASACSLVFVRCLLQGGAARLETSAVFGWVASRRRDLLALAADRAFPAYRDPWRARLTAALDAGVRDLAEGAAAGLRCHSAAAQALALAPLLFLFSWRPALAAAALALPVIGAGRLRAATLARSAGLRGRAGEDLSAEVAAFADGLEDAAGNGRMEPHAAALAGAEARHESASLGWERAKALYPPLLEALFFAALAGLLLLAAPARASGADWPASLLPFAALLLLLYRPLREWARAYPARLPGDRAFAAWRNLEVSLESRPRRAPAPPAPGSLVRFESVDFAYPSEQGSRPVFAGLSLALDPSELTWIPGPNGAGKTTFLRLLCGAELPDAGLVRLPAALLSAREPFAYLPQRAPVAPDWPTWAAGFARRRPEEWGRLVEILDLGPLLARAPGVEGGAGSTAAGRLRADRGSGPTGGFAVAGAAAGDGAAEARRAAAAWAAGLSGGQRQRLALARVFASGAPCLLLDEPTLGLAAGDRERILGDLLAWHRRLPGRGAVLVTHEAFLGEFCSRTLRLEGVTGKVAVAGDRA